VRSCIFVANQLLAQEGRKPLKIPDNLENSLCILYPSPLISALIRGIPHAYDYQATNQMVGTRDFGIFTRGTGARAAALAAR
jgi:hypothetical protein